MCTAAQQAASGDLYTSHVGNTRYLLQQYAHSKEAEFADLLYALVAAPWQGVIQPGT